MLAQTHKDIEIVAVINGNEEHEKEYIQEHFPSVKVIDPGANIRLIKSQNLVFRTVPGDFYQLVNQDMVLTPNFVEEMLKPFADPQVGAVNGKLMQIEWDTQTKTGKIDTTGVTYAKSGRGRGRGQNELDTGQYDSKQGLITIDGAAPMFRREALEAIKMPRFTKLKSELRNSKQSSNFENSYAITERLLQLGLDPDYEYFDEDIDMYWDDVDIGLRLTNAGYKCKFTPNAVAYHARTAGASVGGYKKVLAFIKHHKQLNPWVLRQNYKNHIFLFIKNSPKWYLQFFVREFFYHIYVLGTEITTFKAWPEFFRLLPIMLKKRKWIREHRKISIQEFESLLTK
jgi:GT2 family glycosyltransferase